MVARRKNPTRAKTNQTGSVESSFHKTESFFEQQFAIRVSSLVARELDQVAAVEKILEQRFLVFRKIRIVAPAQ